MAAIDSIIKIQIAPVASPVAADSTTVPLLVVSSVPSSWASGTVVKSYSDLSDLTADGFAETDDAYVYATALLSQSVQPPIFMVGKKAATTLATSDLDAINDQDGTFYAVIIVKATDAEILTAAQWVQAQKKMLFAASASAEIGDPADTTSIAHQLKAMSASRTALMFSPGSADKGIEAAWVGAQLPLTPGSSVWNGQVLMNISADTITSTQAKAIIGSPVDLIPGNGANIYRTVARKGQTQTGTAMDGGYIDNQIGIDWLFFNMQSSLATVLTSGSKLPYTDKGVAVLEAAVTSVIQQGQVNDLIADAYTVKAAKVADVPYAQRAARKAPTIYFTCRLTGALQSVQVQGQVTL